MRYESVGRGFESLPSHQKMPQDRKVLRLFCLSASACTVSARSVHGPGFCAGSRSAVGVQGAGGKAAGIATQDEVQELAGAAAASGIRLTDQTPAGCTVYADQSLLLINLIGNSIKYGVPGGPAYKYAAHPEQKGPVSHEKRNTKKLHCTCKFRP